MAPPAQADVKVVLIDFEERLRGIVDRAWREWLAMPDRGRFVFLPRVRAVLVYDFIARHALTEFDDDPHIHVMVKGQQTIHFLFKNRVLVRFKKGNTKGVGSNIETQSVLDFIDPQGVIPGLVPDILKVEVCYALDDLDVGLDEVAVVARNRHRRIWAYPIHPSSRAVVTDFPTSAPDLTPPEVVPLLPEIQETPKKEE